MKNAARDARLGVGSIALAVVLAAVAAGIAGAGPRDRGVDDPELLPDIVVRPITHLSITKTKGEKLLRFSTIIGNQGLGPVELFPVADDCDDDGDPTNDRSAYQQIYEDIDHDGSFDRSKDSMGRTAFAGCSFFHPAHNHWHFEEFARYTLSRPVSGRVVSRAEKVSFCVRDSIRFGSSIPGSPPFPYYGDCSQDSTSGLSVGWADDYAYYLAGQELDILGLPDHRYCLTLVADPGARVTEADEANDARNTLVRIKGKVVTDLAKACPSA